MYGNMDRIGLYLTPVGGISGAYHTVMFYSAFQGLGLSITTTANPFETLHYATQTTNVTSVNLGDKTVDVVSNYAYNTALIDDTSTTVSADGLSKTVLYDFDGNGVTDQSTTDFITVNE